MKNLRFIPAFLMVLFMGIQAQAKAGNTALVKPEAAFAYSIHAIKNADKFALAFKNRTDEKVVIEIYDTEHNQVFKDVQQRDEMHKVYDLHNIGAGEYTVIITHGTFVAKEQISIGVAEAYDNTQFEAVVLPDAHDADKMRLAFSNAHGSVSISISDSNGYSYYNDTVSDATNFNQVFDLSSLSPGIYTVTLEIDGQIMSKSYAVE